MKINVALHIFCFQLGKSGSSSRGQPAECSDTWRHSSALTDAAPAPSGAQGERASAAEPSSLCHFGGLSAGLELALWRPRAAPSTFTAPASCKSLHNHLKVKVTLSLRSAYWHVNEWQFWLTRENPSSIVTNCETAIISGTWKCRTRDLRFKILRGEKEKEVALPTKSCSLAVLYWTTQTTISLTGSFGSQEFKATHMKEIFCHVKSQNCWACKGSLETSQSNPQAGLPRAMSDAAYPCI